MLFIRYFPPCFWIFQNKDAYGDDPELSPLVLERTCHNDTPPPEQQKQQSTEANGGDADWVGGAGGSDTSKADTSR